MRKETTGSGSPTEKLWARLAGRGGAGAGAALHREHGFRVEDTQRKLGF